MTTKTCEAEVVKRVEFSPRPHQRDAVRDVLKAFGTEDRAQCLMACGTGKTLVGLWVVEALLGMIKGGPKRAIVFVPSIALVKQILEDYLRATKLEVDWMAVCSDPSVSHGEDVVQYLPEELWFPVSTEPNAVRSFLGANGIKPKLVFCTYDSAWVVGDAMRRGESFDVGIFDEAHRTAGRVGKKYSFALSDKNVKIKKRLFMTATPRHCNVNKRGNDGELEEMFSMNSREDYGQVAHELSFRKSADLGLILAFKILISEVWSHELGSSLSDGHVLIDGEKIPAHLVANQLALIRGMERAGARKAISFHGRVAAAQDLAGINHPGLRAKFGSLEAFHVNGKMTMMERTAEMDEFKRAGHGVVTCARCLTEGVDIPAVELVAMMSPRRSRVDVVQAVGRCLRKHGHQKVGWVLLPLYRESREDEGVIQAVGRNGYEEVWNSLQALREEDSLFSNAIRLASLELGETGSISLGRLDQFVSYVGPGVGLVDLEREVMIRIIEKLGESWDVMYGKLLAYKKKHGHMRTADEGPAQKLHWWMNTQRGLYLRGVILKERSDQLDRIGFEWVLSESKWNEMYENLRDYKIKHGTCNVPVRVNKKLSTWVSTQRYHRKQGWLSGEKTNLLNLLGIEWDVLDVYWEKMYAELEAYKSKNGNLYIPFGPGIYQRLRRWCESQRRRYRSKTLHKKHIDRMNRLGFPWSALESRWEEMCIKLEAYVKRHGNADISYIRGPNRQLYVWVSRVRSRYAAGTLSGDKIRRMNQLGLKFRPLESNWDEMYKKLLVYVEKNGNANVPTNDQELGVWVSNRRKDYRLKKLSRDRVSRMNKLGFPWDAAELHWNEMCGKLLSYMDKHGNSDVPFAPGDDRPLASWVSNQRDIYKRGKMPIHHSRHLKKIGFNFIRGSDHLGRRP